MKSNSLSWKSTLVFALLVPVMSMGQAFDSGAVSAPGSTGDYNTAPNWSTGSVPSGGNPTCFGGRTAVLNSVAPDVNAVLLGASLVATNGASLMANNFFIGRTGTSEPGHLMVYDGASLRYSGLTGDPVSLGWDHNVTATLDMYGGSLTSAGARQHLYMGLSGTNSHNTVNMLDGTMEFSQLLMGADVGSTGSDSTFTIFGGILDLSTAIDIGLTSDAIFRVDGSGATAINAGLILRTRSNGTVEFVLDSSGVTPINVSQWMDIADGLLRVDATGFGITGRIILINYGTDNQHFASTDLIFGPGGAGYLEYDSNSLDLVITSASIQPTGYEVWAATWLPAVIGAESSDYDADGLNNLYEYGLGGDPTNALDQGTSPVFDVVDSGSELIYVHPQLSNPLSGLNYYLRLNTDLVAGSWVNTGYTVTGTNIVAGDLDFVTNVTDTIGSQKFIRLIIE